MGVFEDAIDSFPKPIKDLLDDDKVSEVMINGPDEIFVEKGGLVFKVENTFPNEEALVSAMRAIAQSVVEQLILTILDWMQDFPMEVVSRWCYHRWQKMERLLRSENSLKMI